MLLVTVNWHSVEHIIYSVAYSYNYRANRGLVPMYRMRLLNYQVWMRWLTCSCLWVTSVMRFVMDTDIVGWAISRSIAPMQNWMKLRVPYSLRHIGWQSVQFFFVTDEVGIQWQPVDAWSDSHLPAAKWYTLVPTISISCQCVMGDSIILFPGIRSISWREPDTFFISCWYLLTNSGWWNRLCSCSAKVVRNWLPVC